MQNRIIFLFYKIASFILNQLDFANYVFSEFQQSKFR